MNRELSREPERQAERWSYQLPQKKKRDRLIEIAAINIAVANGTLPVSARIEAHGQVEEVLDRVSSGGGAPVELFKIQGDPRGGGFISQVPPRFHELRHRYGFHFENKQEEEKSWWWIVVDDSGMRPRMTDVECAPERDGTPSRRVAGENQPHGSRAATLRVPVAPRLEQQTLKPPAQETLFDLGGRRTPTSTDFVERERGIR